MGREIAEEHGLVRVALASPGLQDETPGDRGTRQWHTQDITLVHEFLQAGLSSKFRFDSNRIVFWGASEGACFLNDFIPTRGASYGGGLYAACGCFNRDPAQAWTTPTDFRTRFRVLVRSTSGDDFREDSAEAYYFYKYKAGLEAFVDLSGEGSQCEPGAVSDSDAIAWLLGTRSLTFRAPDGPSEIHSPWRRRARPEEDPAACQAAAALAEKRSRGTGNALWVSPEAAASLPQFETSYRVATVAGSGVPGDSGDGRPATAARLRSPHGVAVDAAGNLYVGDTGNHRVRRVNPDGLIGGIAGAAATLGDGGPATLARLEGAFAVAVDGAGNLYVAESENHRVRKIDPAGVITTFAGTGKSGFAGDGGSATEARLNLPVGLAVDTAGSVYVADTYNHRVRRIDPAGMITTVAGNGQRGFGGDGGPATVAALNHPTGVAVDATGNLYVADHFNQRVRRVDPAGLISTIAGTGARGFSGDGGPATEARLDSPFALALDATGNLYVTDRGNRRVRQVDPAGLISTIAGTGESGFAGDGGPATAAQLGLLYQVAADAAGNVYVADPGYDRVRRIDPAGVISTIAGTGSQGMPGMAARRQRPSSTTRPEWRSTRPAMSTWRTPTHPA